jgi:hypothetical protein
LSVVKWGGASAWVIAVVASGDPFGLLAISAVEEFVVIPNCSGVPNDVAMRTCQLKAVAHGGRNEFLMERKASAASGATDDWENVNAMN